MRKISVMVAAMALVIFGSVIYGWSQAAPAAAPPAQVDVKAFKGFLKETLPLRDELMVKKVELRNEYAQPTQNPEKIAGIQKEMIDLRAKIQTAAQRHNVSGMGCGWMGGGAGFGRGGCQGAGAGFGRGPGGGKGRGGAGYGKGNCPMWN
jgi:hypothetical protein